MIETVTLLRPATWTETDPLIRLIPQYSLLSDIQLARVTTGEIRSLAQFVNTRRLSFAHSLYAQATASGIPLFRPLVVRIGHLTRLVVPPVAEEHDGKLVLVDGTHRVWLARQRAEHSIEIVVVRGVGVPLPSRPVPWESVTQRDDTYTTEDNLVDFDRSLFRPVTTTFNGPDTVLSECEFTSHTESGDAT